MGRLLAIASVATKRAPLTERAEAVISVRNGIEGDVRGAKSGRQITVLFREGWEAACADLGVALPWVTRRANLYVEGVATPREGSRLVIGGVVLEVVSETQPCQLMEAAHRGLRKALTPDWRGGVCCTVVEGGTIRSGDEVKAIS